MSLEESANGELSPVQGRTSVLSRVLRLEWLGQMAASLCWMASVFCYGLNSAGDWLQLAAAGGWLLANLASVATAGDG
ncbi:MAG: hypothetical protein NXI04_22290 [Planctomycetaceae bacterium]|nr:hypothetical protein [Planctomycetaceae bacterium]